MLVTIVSSLLILWISYCVEGRVEYHGYEVLRVIPEDKTELNSLRELQKSDLGRKLDFWKGASYVNRPVDFMVNPTMKEHVTGWLRQNGLSNMHTFISDIQSRIDEAKRPMSRGMSTGMTFNYTQFNDIEAINRWVTHTANTYAVASEGSLGNSHEGRPIKFLKISHGSPKKAVVLHGGMHAREWLSPASVMYMVKKLVEGGPAAIHVLNLFEFYIIPVLNVDGYAYSWATDRFWRKTRSKLKGTSCVGVDPNRNFDIDWGETKAEESSDDPCSNLYHGPYAFSEVEIAALRDFVTRAGGGTNQGNKGNVALYIDYHTYSQAWTFPFGYKSWDSNQTKTDDRPVEKKGGGKGESLNDRQLLENGARTATEALKRVNGTEYDVGDLYHTIYPVSGDSCDYMYEVQKVAFSYGVEGRDRGDSYDDYGFVAPPSEIQSSGEENWAALVALCNYVYGHVG